MNIKILAQNIVNNPSDFTAEQIEKYFEDYAKLRLSAVSGRSEQLPCEHRSYRAGHSPFVPCICNDCGEEL